MDLVRELANVSPATVWGLLSRGLGLVFLISFASLRPQLLPIAGRAGITPIDAALRAIERDFPSWRRFLYFPSLLWLDASDRSLRALVWTGIFASGSLLIGGPHAPWAFLLCYLVYLSLDRAVGLVYPWDALLFEAGFWGALLPATEVLPRLAAVSAPEPAVAWVFRLLVFRVMVGFGKHKFLGTTRDDSGFLKGFFVGQPLPTYGGWLLQKLPMPMLKLALFGMFVVELALPLLVFVPGPLSAFAGLAVIGLMVAIWTTGNFGYFNPLMIVLALSWFDSATAARLSFTGSFAAAGLHALCLLHAALALIALPFNTFCALTWPMWPAWLRLKPRFWGWPIALYRALTPFRFVHAYGVFPPFSPPAARATVVAEATWDEQTWHALRHRYWPTEETSAPRWCAPHHERFDQAIVYESVGLSERNVYRNAIGRWDPYGHGGPSFSQLLLFRMLRGDVPGDRFYDRELERRFGPPRAVRVRTFLLEPTSLAEWRQSGKFWRRSLVGPHFPPLRLGDGYWEAPLPTPELWHFEDVIWLRRSRLGGLMRRARAGEDVHALVREDAPELSARDVELFWSDFLPNLPPQLRRAWTGLRATVLALRERHGLAQLHRFERIAGRYGALLFAKIEPLFLEQPRGAENPQSPAQRRLKTNYHLRLLSHQIVSLGREQYELALRDPELAREHAEHMTMYSGHLLLALFRYETLVYQSQMLRLLAVWTKWEGRRAPTPEERERREREHAFEEWLWAKHELSDFLTDQFTSEEDRLDVAEHWPRFRLGPDRALVRVS